MQILHARINVRCPKRDAFCDIRHDLAVGGFTLFETQFKADFVILRVTACQRLQQRLRLNTADRILLQCERSVPAFVHHALFYMNNRREARHRFCPRVRVVITRIR